MVEKKKHPCADCHHCQWCSEDRCRLCLKATCVKKLSLAEQIELYEQLNRPQTLDKKLKDH